MLQALGVTTDRLELPLLWKFFSYEKDFISENMITVEMLKNLVEKLKLTKSLYLLDRGFAREVIVKYFLEKKIDFICRATDNFNIVHNNIKTNLSKLTEGVYQEVWIEKWQTPINVVVHIEKRNKKYHGTKFVFFTTKQVVEADIGFFLKEYFKRTKIETSFKNEKQDFGLENFRVLNWKAMSRLIDLVMLAKTVSEIVIRRNSKNLKMVILYLMKFIYLTDPNKKRFTMNNVRKLKDYLLHFGLVGKYIAFLAKLKGSG